jgi:seryl-tRNA synthetase
MLDLKWIRDNAETTRAGLKAKNSNAPLDELLKLDEKKRTLLQEADQLKEERNKANDEVSACKKEGRDAAAVIERTKTASSRIKTLDQEISELELKIQPILLMIPNLADPSVPVGDPSKNKVVREWGKPKTFTFAAKDHVALAQQNGWLGLDRASRMSGSGFVLFQGFGARLERGLINFMLDLHTQKHGYTEMSPPFLVNRQSMITTGQLPKLEEDMYRLKDEDYFLIPTAEVPVTNIHRDEVLEEEELPKKYAAYTPCFRREAGSYGKDTKGLTRVHQFDKVELVKFTAPENSMEELESLVQNAEAVLQALELPYRVVLLASGDMSFAASKCYDLEVWSPGSAKWLEVSSCSNFKDFQARRGNIKYRSKTTKKTTLVHTLNGSGVALARIVIALMENGQDANGQISLPAALKPYLA